MVKKPKKEGKELSIDERLALIREVGEEIITEEELRKLLEENGHPIAYDGFEPSGRIHLAQAVMRSINVNKMTRAGCKFKMLVADWHGWANNKLGGDLEKIQKTGKYFVEVWKAAGMDLDNVEFIWVSDYINDSEYLKRMMTIARHTTLNRTLRCTQIMGRSENDSLMASQIIYPMMQAADIFHLNVDICQLGMDQRKVNMLAREIADKLKWKKPVAVHHHMLMGLGQPVSQEKGAMERAIELKMSKSKPETAIFIDDSEEDVKRKITNAYCPIKQVQENPIMEYCKYIIFEKYPSIKISRPAKFGGNLEINGYAELEKLYAEGKLHPMDLKNAVIFYINEIMNPIRAHFKTDTKAKKLLEEIRTFEITR